jgi:hypothetical protein
MLTTPEPPAPHPTQDQALAVRLQRVASLLQAQGASPYRVSAYLQAAAAAASTPPLVYRAWRDAGVTGLTQLPHIGPALAHVIAEFFTTGDIALAQRLEGGAVDEPSRTAPAPHDARPSVADLLDIDREYRRRAGTLPRITPRQFNPNGNAWLPVLHTTRGDRHFTALFSNSGRAHELGRTHDWVVIHAEDGTGGHQWTVVTPRVGALKGRRVVRGREPECLHHYRHPSRGRRAVARPRQ